jgi:methylated-DNA-protein-cysteine methyltransferase-like protein
LSQGAGTLGVGTGACDPVSGIDGTLKLGTRKLPTDSKATCDAIIATLRKIPTGSVASYGQIARLAGYPRHARLVGRLVQNADAAVPLPWHRVLNSQGHSSLPEGSLARAEQWQRLRAEGVIVANERVNMKRFGWRSGRGDSPLLD